MDVIGWDSAFGESLRTLGSDVTTVTCASGGVTEDITSNEPRLLDLLAAARDRNGRLQVRTCRNTSAVPRAQWDTSKSLASIGSSRQDGREDIVDKMGVYDIVPRSDSLLARWVAQEFRGR